MWIEHDGKGAPDLPEGTLIAFRCRDGYEDNDPTPFEGLGDSGFDSEFDRSWWMHNGRDNDIVAYRVVQP